MALCNVKECWLLFMKEVCTVDRVEYGMWNPSAWMQSLDPPLNMYVTLPGVPPNFMQQESMCQKFGQDIAGHVVSPHTFWTVSWTTWRLALASSSDDSRPHSWCRHLTPELSCLLEHLHITSPCGLGSSRHGGWSMHKCPQIKSQAETACFFFF